jgi:hypothetical protein
MAGYTATDRWIMNGGIILVGACYLLTGAGLTALRASARVLLAIGERRAEARRGQPHRAARHEHRDHEP